MKLLGPVLKSLTWVGVTTLFGLLQLWLTFFKSLLVKTTIFPYEKILLDGVLLFFVTAVVTALTTDYYLSKIDYPKWLVGIVFGFYPLLIVIVSVGLFFLFLYEEIRNLDIFLVEDIEKAIMIMTSIYAIVVKLLEYSTFFDEEVEEG